ncbi:MAG: Pyruvate synthase subunit PorC [Calditrichaeota bacterium]|nr:Pyruvate synthase subunit PorC [Calditrichota bacterium]
MSERAGERVELTLPVEIRWHGRGGQGAVTAAKLLAEIGVAAGRHVQSFPQFGSERRGAPIQAFTRIDARPITLYSSIREPGVVIVLDASLLALPPTLAGLRDGGLLLVNAEPDEFEQARASLPDACRVATVPATRIALAQLGRPMTNTAMLGALVGVTGLFELADVRRHVEAALAREHSEQVVAANLNALEEACRAVSGN